MSRHTENDVEQQQVRDHERHREVQQTPRKALVRRRRERNDERLHNRVQERERPEERDALLEHVQRPDAPRARVLELVHERRRELVPRKAAERDVRRPAPRAFDRARKFALELGVRLRARRDRDLRSLLLRQEFRLQVKSSLVWV